MELAEIHFCQIVFHFPIAFHGERGCAYSLLLYEANGVGVLWANRMGGGILPCVSGR